MYNEVAREATVEEVKVYNKVEEVLNTLTDEEYEKVIETVSERVFGMDNNKTTYNKVYRLAKKYGFTVEEMETWYCIDTY